MPTLTIEAALDRLNLPFTLAPLQLIDAKELVQYDRVGLFWDVGVGKTVESTVLAKAWNNDTTLVVVPPILIAQWREWLQQVDPTSRVKVYYGPKRSAADMEGEWVITSHSIFRNDFPKLQAHFLRKSHTLIVDEAQGLKDVRSKLYRCVKGLCINGNLVLATGTATSKPEDAYSYISLKTPKVYRSYSHFTALHVAEVDFFGNVVAYRDLERISENLMLQASKRTKEEVFAGQLNPPVYTTLNYELDPQHKKLYDQLVDECLLELVNSGQKIDATTPQRLYHLTQQMVLNWGYFADDPTKRAQGMDFVDQMVEQTECLDPSKTKLMIWTYYVRTTEMVLEYIRKKYGNVVVAAYSGADSKRSVSEFMFNPACRIFVGQPLSAGVGLNAMTVCWAQLFLEFSTVPMHIRQSIGRVDRMGQQHIPNIWFAVAQGTVQVKLLSNLLRNDANVSIVERNPQTLREALLGR